MKTDLDLVRIQGLVRKTMRFARTTYHSEWEACISLLVGSRLIAQKAGDIDWEEMVAVVEELVKSMGVN